MDRVTNEQIEGLKCILSAILSNDNFSRKQKEQELNSLRQNHPNEVVICMLAILESAQEASLRMLSAVLLRQFLTIFTINDSKMWERLLP